jgi:hypothetical protein
MLAPWAPKAPWLTDPCTCHQLGLDHEALLQLEKQLLPAFCRPGRLRRHAAEYDPRCACKTKHAIRARRRWHHTNGCGLDTESNQGVNPQQYGWNRCLDAVLMRLLVECEANLRYVVLLKLKVWLCDWDPCNSF